MWSMRLKAQAIAAAKASVALCAAFAVFKAPKSNQVVQAEQAVRPVQQGIVLDGFAERAY